MRAVVTRPASDAARWVEQLATHGIDAVALPLISIAPAADQQGLHAAWTHLASFDAVMFVSANAAEQFYRARPPGLADDGMSPHAQAWATGPGSEAALQHAGVPAARIVSPPADAAQFDSEALWALVQLGVRKGSRVLIVRGADENGRVAGRDWLYQRLVAAGAEVRVACAYERHLPALDGAQRALAHAAACDGSVWLFSSSQAVTHLQQLLPGESWAAARAIATHARIAKAARDAGFGVVCESRPQMDAVAASIKSLQ